MSVPDCWQSMQTISDLEKLIEASQSAGNGLEEAHALARLGDLYRQNRKWNLAVNSYKRSLKLYQEAEDPPHVASAHACLGTVFWEQSQLRKAMECFERAIQVLNELEDEEGLSFVQAILAISYWRQGDWNQAIALMESILPVSWAGAEKNYHSLLEVLEKAVPLLENRVRAAKGNDNQLRWMQAHFTLIPLYLCLGKTDTARKHFGQAESLAGQLKQENILATLPKLMQFMKP